MKLLLFDTADRNQLFPLTLTRATATLRIGIDTLREKWERLTGLESFIVTEKYLQPSYGEPIPGLYLLVCSNVLPLLNLVEQISALQIGEALSDEYGLIAGKLELSPIPSFGTEMLPLFSTIKTVHAVKRLIRPNQLFQWNEQMIVQDFEHYRASASPNVPPPQVQLTNAPDIFIHERAVVEHAVLNASNGPIYIGKNATIMEGCLIRGPFALCEGAVLKMGTKVYGATTIGPYCVAGGEIKNSILSAYSNKAHDGYLGDSIVGEWCNLGAGTSNSNLKNNVGQVKLWNYGSRSYGAAGMKCGLVMGDYSRSSVNTSFNTGTVVGVCSNVFGEGLTPTFIPDFTWGTNGTSKYEFDKAINDIANWKRLKNRDIDPSEVQVLKHIFDHFNH